MQLPSSQQAGLLLAADIANGANAKSGLALPRLRQIIVYLKVKPGLGRATKSFAEPDRHFGRNTGLTID
jgi:hypothetical protein